MRRSDCRRRAPSPSAEEWEALVHPGPEAEAGRASGVRGRRRARCTARSWSATSRGGGRFGCGPPSGCGVDAAIERIGHVPLPPYIKRAGSTRRIASGIRRCTRASADRSRRRPPGCTSRRRCSTSSTARGIERARVTLHVGYGTFKPVRVEHVEEHAVDPETYRVSAAAAAAAVSTRAPRRAAASSPSARRRRARWSRWTSAQAGDVAAGRRRDRALHPPGPPLSRRGRAGHQLPPAAVVAADARGGASRAASASSRRIARPSSAVSLLQLRRRDADCLGARTRTWTASAAGPGLQHALPGL